MGIHDIGSFWEFHQITYIDASCNCFSRIVFVGQPTIENIEAYKLTPL